MTTWERQTSQSLHHKPPSFSSTLLDAIYHSIDDHAPQNRRNAQVEEDIESLRRAIMIEKWIQSHTNSTKPNPLETESPASSETESPVSKTSPKIFTKTKTKAQKIYSELKKVKEPISPGGKITNFLNSLFTSKTSSSYMRKSRSMKDTSQCPSLASRSCLSKNASSGGSKSKRSVRFCPVSVILDEDSKPCGQKSLHGDECGVNQSGPSVGGRFIKRNVESVGVYEKNLRKNGVRDCYDFDNMSCESSDLFELEELPVYGTTRVRFETL